MITQAEKRNMVTTGQGAKFMTAIPPTAKTNRISCCPTHDDSVHTVTSAPWTVYSDYNSLEPTITNKQHYN